MKKLILGAWMAVMAFSINAQEQERSKKSPEEIAKMRVERMKTSLDLNTEQETTITNALLTKMSKSKTIREENSGDREAMKTAMKPVKREFHQTMKNTLSEEQYTKWKEMHSSKRSHKKGHAKRGEHKKSKDCKEGKHKKTQETEKKQMLEDK